MFLIENENDFIGMCFVITDEIVQNKYSKLFIINICFMIPKNRKNWIAPKLLLFSILIGGISVWEKYYRDLANNIYRSPKHWLIFFSTYTLAGIATFLTMYLAMKIYYNFKNRHK